MAKEFRQMWITQLGSVFPAMVKPWKQSWRSQNSDLIYRPECVHAWDDLTDEQKKKALEAVYAIRLDAANMTEGKDPGLAEQVKNWKRQAAENFTLARERIDNGEPIDEPNPYD